MACFSWKQTFSDVIMILFCCGEKGMELEGNVEDCAGFFFIAVPSALGSEFSCLETVLGEKTVILLFFFFASELYW